MELYKRIKKKFIEIEIRKTNLEEFSMNLINIFSIEKIKRIAI
jgi:hypothetical protein